MKKAIVYGILLIGASTIVSCAVTNGITPVDVANGRGNCNSCDGHYTPTDISAKVKRETKRLLQSPVIRMAGAEMDEYTYYLIINENKTFSAVVNVHGTRQYDFRAGTFYTKGDTLNLNYYKNITSAYLTDRVLVDYKKREMYFLNDDQARTTRLKILNEL